MTETTRLERSKSIGRRAARRESFRAYWRENGGSYYERWPHSTRRARRSLAWATWQAEENERDNEKWSITDGASWFQFS